MTMTSNIDKHIRELRVAIDLTEDKAAKAVRAAAIQTFSDIIAATPVGNPTYWKSTAPKGYSGGSLRGNWQTSLNNQPQSTIDREQKGESGSATADVVSKTGTYSLSDSIYFVNNLPYAELINDGYSVQPGAEIKFVDKNLAKFSKTLDTIAKRLR